MFIAVDQLNRTLILEETPQKIVSLVPSITELLFDLGVNVVGRTKFCIHPKEQIKSAKVVGGTKTLHLDRIIALQPDLIIANKEENQQEQIEALAEQLPVWISDVPTIEAGISMIRMLGEVLDKKENARTIAKSIQFKIEQFQRIEPTKVAYLIWEKPYMTIGKDTYIHDMLKKLGYINVFQDQTRYPIITIEILKERQPDVIFLSSEPFPFKQKHINALKSALGDVEVQLVDGEFFSWYGSRLLKIDEYLQ